MKKFRLRSPFVMATVAGVAAVVTDFGWLLFDWLVKPAHLFSYHFGYGLVAIGLIASALMGLKAMHLFQVHGHARTERLAEIRHRQQRTQVNRYRNFERRVYEVTGEKVPHRRDLDRVANPENERRISTENQGPDTPRRRRTDRT